MHSMSLATWMVGLTVYVSLIYGPNHIYVDAVLIVPGWEENPTKYEVDVFIICDYYCYTNFLYGIDPQTAYNRIIDLVASVSQGSTQLNLQYLVVGVEIWNLKSQSINWTTSNPDVQGTLSWLYGVRQTYLQRKVYFDDLVLISGITYSYWGRPFGGVHGLGTIGNADSVGCIQTTNPVIPSIIIQSFTHELGHGVGMNHDVSTCQCDVGPLMCTMTAYIVAITPRFSACSLASFAGYMAGPNSRSLKKPFPSANVLIRRTADRMCGNGVIDAGETCDCGPSNLPAGCSACCVDCRLRSGAQCSDGMCCNSQTCQFKPAQTSCRVSRDSSCDMDDYCSGLSSTCSNSYRPDWSTCIDSNNDNGYCKTGFCNTINNQCKFAWNSAFRGASSACFNAMLSSPSSAANCGVTSSGSFQSCSTGSSKNFKCQTLICASTDSTVPVPYGRSQQTFSAGGNTCITGSYLPYEYGLLGMPLGGLINVDNGTMCGNQMACYNGDCLALSSVIQTMASLTPYSRRTAYCGNGVVDTGEDCDCGAFQCQCCNLVTCKFVASGSPCLAACGTCDGRSTGCANTNAMSDFNSCGPDSTGQCFKKSCASLNQACYNHFTNLASYYPVSQPSSNVGQNTNTYNSGGVVLKNSNDQIIYQFYRRGEDDGTCGIVQCNNGNAGYYINPTLTGVYRSYAVSITSTMKVLYYNNVTLNTAQYTVWYPVLAMEGTPCTLQNNVRGYCRNMWSPTAEQPTVMFAYSKCNPVPTSNARAAIYDTVDDIADLLSMLDVE